MITPKHFRLIRGEGFWHRVDGVSGRAASGNVYSRCGRRFAAFRLTYSEQVPVGAKLCGLCYPTPRPPKQ